jgi:hypothetical protein
MKKSSLLLILICGLSLLSGCGTTTTPPPIPMATHFSFSPANATPTAGTAFNVTVTALDSTNVAVPSYVGTVHFSSSDALAVLPPDSSLTSGTGTFSVTLKTAGNQTITATDTRALTGTFGPITVKTTGATQFSVVPATSTISTGVAFNFTVTALDALNNPVTSYSGTVHFSSTDGSAILPGNSTLTNGTGTFSATLKTSGNQTIMAADTVTASLTGTSFAISASGPATHFSFSSVAAANTRKTITILVNALDASNNGSTGYNGTVRITSSTDPIAILPANTTLQTGSGNFQVTLETPGPQTVTATDTVTPSITGTTNSIAVTATPALNNTSGAPPNGTVGSIYGPTFVQYLKCVRSNQTGFYTCTPCVPNTSGCGGSYPTCPRRGVTPPTCVSSERFVGSPLTATGGLPPYTWAASSLPAGLSLKSQSPETLISGTPSPGAAATYNVSVTVTDSGTPKVTTNPIIYAIVINNPPPPVVSTAPLFPGATVNQPFSYTFTATAGLPPYQNWTEKGALPPGITPLTSGGALAGTPTMTGSFPITVTVDDSLGQMSAALSINFQVYQHGFKADGSMGTARTSHTATLLPDGTVLLAGGLGLSSAEIYDSGTGKFTPTAGSMSVARLGHTATLLTTGPYTGKVLITGGQASFAGPAYATAELFDPGTGIFMLTSNNMSIARTGHNATLLADGKVLITGGESLGADLFDPITGMFTPTTGNMVTARYNDTATLLTNGEVLFTGGFNGAGLATAELYNPTTETFSATTGTMAVTRLSHTATLLTTGTNAGKVLVAGGTIKNPTAELYDPTPGTFSTTGTMQTEATGTATLLSDGTVLMAGGQDPTTGTEVTLAELYNPNTGTFTGTGGMQTPRLAHTATLLKNGTVLVTGGVNTSGTLASAELYQ